MTFREAMQTMLVESLRNRVREMRRAATTARDAYPSISPRPAECQRLAAAYDEAAEVFSRHLAATASQHPHPTKEGRLTHPASPDREGPQEQGRRCVDHAEDR